MKYKNIIKIISSILLVLVSTFIYSSTFGNPISYIKAKSEISSYINEKYGDELQIEKLFYSFKTNGYSAIVARKNDNRDTSYIEYYNTGNINDGYQFEVRMSIEDEVAGILESLINQGTNLNRANLGIESSIEIEAFKYNLSDKYSGEEPIDLQIWLHPEYNYTEKQDPNQEVALYKNKEDFSKDVYEIMDILSGTKYKFNSIEIYSYREDGNSNYRFESNMKEEIKSIEDINNKVFIGESEKGIQEKRE